ncbi:hypothetical protein H4R26_000879 [Coemansia thaxteri]|uniref:Uncharacterized protein n=1 Tax=Coemansia thaxteri TaxID=2663907 RepID=A0A9W8EHG5_9FUNG|nr:hypothetical protein H4R26_000879 [Coemansia thaxteri]KAJ2487144.1 hypothetical protein EV174_000686 [Coemansia sp. RSA 2320]
MVQSFNPAGLRAAFALLRRPHMLMPHIAVPDMRTIPYEALHAAGIKYLVFDKDNCLTAPYANHIHPEFAAAWSRCLALFARSSILIVSNSAGTPDDIDACAAAAVESALAVPVLRHTEKKPACGPEILAALGAKRPDEVAVIGDRLATDVVLANANGMLAIWTTNIVSAQGDNPVAAALRSLEHHAYGVLRRRNIRPPAHPLEHKLQSYISKDSNKI